MLTVAGDGVIELFAGEAGASCAVPMLNCNTPHLHRRYAARTSASPGFRFQRATVVDCLSRQAASSSTTSAVTKTAEVMTNG